MFNIVSEVSSLPTSTSHRFNRPFVCGPQVDPDVHESLMKNIPAEHPARYIYTSTSTSLQGRVNSMRNTFYTRLYRYRQGLVNVSGTMVPLYDSNKLFLRPNFLLNEYTHFKHSNSTSFTHYDNTSGKDRMDLSVPHSHQVQPSLSRVW